MFRVIRAILDSLAYFDSAFSFSIYIKRYLRPETKVEPG